MKPRLRLPTYTHTDLNRVELTFRIAQEKRMHFKYSKCIFIFKTNIHTSHEQTAMYLQSLLQPVHLPVRQIQEYFIKQCNRGATMYERI